MKKFITLIAALCMAVPAMAAPKKEAKEKEKKKEKEVPAQLWTVVIEGARAEVGAAEVKGLISSMQGVSVEECTQKEALVEAVISSKSRVSRSDVSKALKDNKDLKVREFKTRRAEKEDTKKEDTKKDPLAKKDEPVKAADGAANPEKDVKKETPEKK